MMYGWILILSIIVIEIAHDKSEALKNTNVHTNCLGLKGSMLKNINVHTNCLGLKGSMLLVSKFWTINIINLCVQPQELRFLSILLCLTLILLKMDVPCKNCTWYKIMTMTFRRDWGLSIPLNSELIIS
jgi:hypothetical protein